MIGITAYGAYIPTARLSKKVIAEANAWFDAGLNSLAKGERSICNWDEDTVTMAVEAATDCLSSLNNKSLSSLYMASTTFPFVDRQNSVLLSEALNLNRSIRSMDIGASQRAATSALIALLEANNRGNSMLVASEHRRTKAGSRSEMLWGDAAAALTVGAEKIIAEFLGAESLSVDFIDHYRGEGAEFDYEWEERWTRDEGFMKILPGVVAAVLGNASVQAKDIKHFILPTDQARTPSIVAKKLGIKAEAIVDNQIATVGVAGAAQAILLLAKTIQNALPGDLVLLTGFGQGCDAILLRVTDLVHSIKPKIGVNGSIARGRKDTNYNRFMSFNNLVEKDIGKRGEADKQTFLSGYNRRKNLLTSFLGGKCRSCGTVQIPRDKYCVNPDCNELESQEDYSFSDKNGKVATWTADKLTFDWNPPAYFGMVEFEGGGKLMMDFTEVAEGGIESGSEISVHFRIKQFDTQRGFRKYFWKALVES